MATVFYCETEFFLSHFFKNHLLAIEPHQAAASINSRPRCGQELGSAVLLKVHAYPQHNGGKNAGLEKAQAGIKIAERNINKVRYADDATLTEDSEVQLKTTEPKAFAFGSLWQED